MTIVRTVSAALLPVTFLLAGCVSSDVGGLEPGEQQFFLGDWCTEGTLDATGFPVEDRFWVGLSLFQQGNTITGSGSLKREGETMIWDTAWEGPIAGNRLSLNGTPVPPPGGEVDEEAPSVFVDVEVVNADEMTGIVEGDPGINGSLTLLRSTDARCRAG